MIVYEIYFVFIYYVKHHSIVKYFIEYYDYIPIKTY